VLREIVAVADNSEAAGCATKIRIARRPLRLRSLMRRNGAGGRIDRVGVSSAE